MTFSINESPCNTIKQRTQSNVVVIDLEQDVQYSCKLSEGGQLNFCCIISVE
jgi:hypothetical protein